MGATCFSSASAFIHKLQISKIDFQFKKNIHVYVFLIVLNAKYHVGFVYYKARFYEFLTFSVNMNTGVSELPICIYWEEEKTWE